MSQIRKSSNSRIKFKACPESSGFKNQPCHASAGSCRFMRLWYPFLLFIMITLSGNIALLQAQPGTVSEKEVEIQKIFIEASKEKILGRFEDAAALYKEVLKKDKENHAAAYELARVYDVLDENDKAVASAQMAVALLPNNTWYQMFLGDVYQKVNKHSEAADIYRTLIKNDPNNEYYYFKLAFFLVAAKEVEEAIKVYDDLEKKIGINEETINRKHRLYLGMGNEKKAARELERLIEAFPEDTGYLHLLAGFYEQSNQKGKAKVVYQNILKIDPNDAKAALALMDGKRSPDNDVAYLQSLKPIFSNKSADMDAKIKKLIPFIQKVAQGEKESTELSEATLELAQILEEQHPNKAKVFSAHGDLLYYSGKPKAALEKYERAIDLNENVFTVWEQIMYIHTELNDVDGLIKVSEEAMDLFPNRPKTYYFNGLANNQKGNYMDAIDMYQQALMMSKKKPRLQFDIYTKLGEAYFQSNKFEKSFDAFDKALVLNPKSTMVLNNYSYLLAQRGIQLEKAKAMAMESTKLNPNDATAQATYGWVLYKMKSYKTAKTWFEKALANGGDQIPTILENYGDVLFQLNDVENALVHWQKAQEKGADSEILEKKIADKQLYE